jgi:hypothetical protein
MAIQRGPKIVTSNLIRCWDAADFKYSRSSWVDLAGSGDYITYNGGYGTSSNFGGYWSMGSLNFGLSLFPAAYTGQRTFEFWINSRESNPLDTLQRGWAASGTNSTNAGFSFVLRGTTELGFNGGNIATPGDTTWRTISGGVYNRWMLFAVTYSGTTLTWYVNGQSIYSQTITLVTGNSASDNTLKGLGYAAQPTNIWFGAIRIYSIALSASQILQNFNSQRGRFGI